MPLEIVARVKGDIFINDGNIRIKNLMKMTILLTKK